MLKIRVLYPESFKPRIFEGVNFPVTVSGEIIKRGPMRGWVKVYASEFTAAGAVDISLYPDSELEFSPAAFEAVQV